MSLLDKLRKLVVSRSEQPPQSPERDQVLLKCVATLTLTGFSSGNTLRRRRVVFDTRKITYSPPPKGYWPLSELWYDEIVAIYTEGPDKGIKSLTAQAARAAGGEYLGVRFRKRGGARAETLSFVFADPLDALRCEELLQSKIRTSRQAQDIAQGEQGQSGNGTDQG